MSNDMKILCACEESQAVTKELRRLGHEAYSCDILPPSGGHPEWHIMQDVLPLLNGRCKFTTMDGQAHEISERWDMIIAHPPCTYLSNVCTRGFSLKCEPAEKVIERWKSRAYAVAFFMHFVLADCERIAVENPVGFMNTAYKKPSQIIDPYMFAESTKDSLNYVTKRTCLWLKGLAPLKTNALPRPLLPKRVTRDGKLKSICWEETVSTDRARNRSKTFPGIARAMAEQWGRAKSGEASNFKQD